MRKLARGGIGTVMAAILALVLGVPSPAYALTYNYYAGHPANRPDGGTCTGAYTIYGTSGSFILTAGHCFTVGERVWGTDASYGTVAYTKSGVGDGDSALIRYDSWVTPYQIVVDPKTGRSPGNGGRVTGKMPNHEQTNGTLVGKMGVTTGWTEGRIGFRYDRNGKYVFCADYLRDKGDSGGPVWRLDSQGLRAVGMHTNPAQYNGKTYGCYIPIDTLLVQWGASMNFFPAARTQAPSDELMPPSESKKLPPIITEADGLIILPPD